MNDLINKKILFIICGGISAYKSLETIRLFKKNNAEIKTILTKSAKEFVTPLSIASLSQGKVYDDLFNIENETEMDHISLSRWADVIVIVPATANTLSKLSNGYTEDLASTVILASNKQVFLAPAMTWLFVITIPSSLMINPEPKEEAFLSVGLSKSLNISPNGDPGGNEGICLDLSSITVVVEILTTEGLSFSARSAKLSGALLA